MPRVEILIVSYLGDRDWLVHCLNSVRKFCAGFSGVTVLVPEVEQAEFASFRESHGVRLACYDRQPDPVLWHLDHQRMKSRADVVCPEAELILHVDSDCVFTEFNALGQVALSEPWHDRYHIIDKSVEKPPASKLMQFWSHGGFHGREHLAERDGECAADVFRRLGI